MIKSEVRRQLWSALVLGSAYVETSSSYREDEVSALVRQNPEGLWGSGVLPAASLDTPCRGASPGSPDCTGCSPVARNASSPPGPRRCRSGTFGLRFHGLPWGVSCARELRGVLPPASLHRLPRPWEGIILCLTRYLEITLSSSQVKDKMPTESGHRIWTKQHKCCCKGCKWGKRFLIGF